MKSRNVLFAAVLTLVLVNTASAFDGQRKGFVVGGGAGFSPNASWKSDAPDNPKDNGAGFGVNVLVGYAWDRANIVALEGNVVAYDSHIRGGDVRAYQGFRGISWYHYFGREGRSFFTVAGLGLYAFLYENFDNNNDATNDQGVGGLVGGGYEFTRHLQVCLYGSAGRTSTSEFDYDHTHISVLVNAVLF